MIATCLVDGKNTLGEGCFWDPRDQALYWTDIEERRIYRRTQDGSVTAFLMPERAGFILPRKDPGFVIGLESRIVVTDPAMQILRTIAIIEPGLPQTRVNDAAVDPFGGIVFGTFDEKHRLPVASLYRLSPKGDVRRLIGDITISNGIAFSPDEELMYFADTPVGTIRRFEVGPGFDRFQEINPLAGPAIAPGSPDGGIVDMAGHYWSARVWGACVVRLSPQGAVVDKIDLPTKGPTCLALGGRDLNTLFVTTLRVSHTADELQRAPQAGGLFSATVRVAGQVQQLSLI